MNTQWLSHLPAQDRDEFKQRIVLAAPVLERMQEVINSKLAQSTKESRSKTNYESPSWALMQADYIGYARALNELLSFISLEKTND